MKNNQEHTSVISEYNEPIFSSTFSDLDDLISGLQLHISWQLETYGNVDLQRCEHVLKLYAGDDRKDKVTFSEKRYTRYAVSLPENISSFDVYLMGWNVGQMSDIHDHASNGCIMKFLEGEVTERRYDKHENGFVLKKETIYKDGDTAYISDNIGYHAIGTDEGISAVSLHVYSPAKYKTTFYGSSGKSKEEFVGTVADQVNDDLLQNVSLDFRPATKDDEGLVKQLMEEIMRPYAEQVFKYKEQVETYMRVNSEFEVQKTYILQSTKDGMKTPIGRIVLSVEDFDGHQAIVVHQLQVKKTYLHHSSFSSAGFYSRLLKLTMGGAFKKSLRRLDMPVIFQIIKKSPLNCLYTNGFLGLFFRNVTEEVGMEGGKRYVFGYFPEGTNPANYQYTKKRLLLEQQGIFDDDQKEIISSSKHSIELIDKTVTLIKTYLGSIESGERKVINFHQPSQLKEIFDFSVTEEGESDEIIFEALQDVLDKSVATQHPRFFNQLYAGANIYSTIAEWITSVLNTSMYTYEVGPVFTLMEEYVYERLADIVGRTGAIDGLMLPGGSNSNITAMQMARYAHNPNIAESGIFGTKKMYVLTSDESHYSITKSAMLMGLGKDAVIKIATDDTGRMDVSALEQKIMEIHERNEEVFMINATSGTTVLGAYDPLDAIAKVGKKYDIRVHVDMIRGGTVMFEESLKEKIKGIDQVDSFSWNPHKMMGASMQCSIRMTQRPGIVGTCNVLKTQYLFANDKGYGVGCDTGDKYSQCGRRVDVLKFRLLWKSLGDAGIAKNTRKAFNDAKYLVGKIQASSNLYLYKKPDCTNVCFWYIPDDLTLPGTSHEDNLAYIKSHYHRIHTLTAKIKDCMLEKGEMMTNYSHTKGFPNFFRMICISPETTHADLDFVVDHIQALGKEVG